jgi:MFS family permease
VTGGEAAPDPGRLRQEPAPRHHTHHALRAARAHLGRRALKLLGLLVLAYLVLRLVPSLRQALGSLEHVGWQWVVGAVAVEVLSEIGFVVSWRAIVDPENVMERDGRGRRVGARVAWAQLGGGMLVPGGSLSGVGVGAWILHRLGMPTKLIAERQFNLSFLNTAVDALALVVFGVGLAIGVIAGTQDVLLTLLPTGVALVGIAAALLIARRAAGYARRLRRDRPKLAATVTTVADAVEDTDRLLFHRGGWKAVVGAVAYLGFDTLVLWSAFLAINAHPVPSYAVVVMAYIIGALGGSLPLPAGIGAAGGIAGVLIVYRVGHNAAVASVVLYEAIGLLVPLIGGAIAYAVLRRQFGPLPGDPSERTASVVA